MLTQVADVFDNVLKLLGKDGKNWGKGPPLPPQGKLCVGFAISQACVSHQASNTYDHTRQVYIKVIGQKNIPQWQDQSHIAWADIEKSLNDARELAKTLKESDLE